PGHAMPALGRCQSAVPPDHPGGQDRPVAGGGMNMTMQSTRQALDIDQLLSEASQRANGLSHFGDDNYRQALEVLVDALDREAKLSDTGRYLMRERLVGQLFNRLVMEDYLRRFPEITRIAIDDPLVI